MNADMFKQYKPFIKELRYSSHEIINVLDELERQGAYSVLGFADIPCDFYVS